MLSVNIHPHHSMIEFWVCALQNLIVLMFFVINGVKAFEDKLKKCSKILRWRRSHKDVAEAIDNCSWDRNA